MKRRAAATIYDIAKLAGVNPSTVSRALTKPGRINAETEKRIRQAASELNYRHNPMARALLTGRTRMLGLIVSDITNPMFFSVIRGAQNAAAAQGYTITLSESQESREREAETAERLVPSVDALVLVTTRLADEQIRGLAERKPLVVINRKVEGVHEILPDLAPGFDQLLTHLAGLGHHSLAYLSGPDNSWMSRARWDLLVEKVLACRMTIVEIGPHAPTLVGGRAALSRVVASGVSAVIAYNDLMAIGLMFAAQEHGIDIPGGLSVVGFDDIFGSDFTAPQLSTIRTPLDVMGARAIERALTLIDDEVVGAPVRLDQSPLHTTLVVRGSTGRSADHSVRTPVGP